ncbi:reverse transcriptase [Plakobranchus ocellatus]|uniref:Reverse transcriptase n=1 Tax=Plakobranchus ocellatus TaxID=259542 RepID=A0AAV4A644_9GAST|nr:reverse transcriptase [Plakobranchus ocellatus]
MSTHRKGLRDGCDDWVVSADLPGWERHPDVIRKTALRPDIMIHSVSTHQIIMVELTVPMKAEWRGPCLQGRKIPGLDKRTKKGCLRSYGNARRD